MSDISSVMTAHPASCEAGTPLPEVARLMQQHDCGQIPVVDAAGKPVGVITDRDIVVKVLASGKDAAAATAADAMSAPARTVPANTSLADCAALMEQAKIRRVPVVDEGGKLVGMVAIADIARAGKDETTAQVVKEVSQPGRS